MARFAWPQYRQPWALEVTVDNPDEVPGIAIDSALRRIRLDLVEDWETVTVSVELATHEKAPVELSDPRGYALIESSRTGTRIPAALHDTGHGFAGSMELRRNELAGVVQISAQVVHRLDVIRLVGEAQPWTVIVDPGEAPPMPGEPPFETVVLSFASDPKVTKLKEFAGSYAMLDTAQQKPVLYLNKDVEGLESILYAKAPKLEKRRLRDVMAAQIAHYAVSALFREAIAQIEFEGDSPQLPIDHLYRQVLDRVAEQVSSAGTAETLVAQLLTDSPAARHETWLEVDHAFDRLTNLAEAIARNCSEVHYA